MNKLLFYLSFLLLTAGCYIKKQKDDVLIRDALADYNSSNFAKAFLKMNDYTKIYPGDYQGWSFLGTIAMQMDQDSLGLIYLNKALALNPKDYKAITGLGVLERKAGHYEKAAEYYYKAISIDPTYSRAYGSLVIIELKKGNIKKAVELGEKTQKLEPDDLTMIGNLAIAYHMDKQFEKRDAIMERLKENGYPYVATLQLLFNGNFDLSDL